MRNFGVLPSPSPEVHNSVARIRPHENPQLPDQPPSVPSAEKAGELEKLPSGESAGDDGKLPTPAIAPAIKVPEHSVRGKVLEKI